MTLLTVQVYLSCIVAFPYLCNGQHLPQNLTMQNLKTILSLLLIALTLNGMGQLIHHELSVELNIGEKSIIVVDTVFIPKEILNGKNSFAFSLNNRLNPETTDQSFEIIKMPTSDRDGFYNNYTIRFYSDEYKDLIIPLTYSGIITDEIVTGADEYARGFSETKGTISDAGVYLAGSTYWIPTLTEPLFSFNLMVRLQSSWSVVSQGERIQNQIDGDTRTVRYSCLNPTEEVYLVAANWTEYEQKAGDVLVQAFLRTPDSALANRYLDATAGYLNMYVDLVGPYPYTKFALVENFWETGYGMPSFTLLGEKIIRFPWILYTSYPHELLHNWWGNSVYVDFKKGNWCEGLTAYMADHLLKEQSGQGADYRRTTLQKFTDYVNVENDFPVLEFRSRNNSAEEAIGYGKSLMFNHMLRKRVGDENFINAYQSFYEDNIYKISTFDDIQASFQKYSEYDLETFFHEWLKRKGAPAIELSEVSVGRAGKEYKLSFTITQTQDEDVFNLDVPVAIYMENEVKLIEVSSYQRSNSYNFMFSSKPVKIEVDPQFDVFRKLDKKEVPPSFSQIFGSVSGTIILPKNSPMLVAYKILAETWKKTQEAQGKSLQILLDEELETLPENGSAWVIGFENKFANRFNIQKEYGSVLDQDQKELISTLTSEGSLVYAIPHPDDQSFTLGFIGTNVEQAVPGLTRLLSHYGKYSYLGFEGERPNNVLKGNFPALSSPLFYSIPYEGNYQGTNAMLIPSKALID